MKITNKNHLNEVKTRLKIMYLFIYVSLNIFYDHNTYRVKTPVCYEVN